MTNTDSPIILPHWELDSIYPGLESAPFEQDVRSLADQLDEIDGFIVEQGIAVKRSSSSDVTVTAVINAIEHYLERMNAAMRLNAELRLYVWCIIDTDSSNQAAIRRLSELDKYNARIKQQTTQFQSWLGRQGALIPDITSQSEAAQAHALYLKETAEQSRYLMSEAEESLAGELALSGINAWSRMHGKIWSQLEAPLERDGTIEHVSMPMLQNIALYDPDGNMRERAAEAEVRAWAGMREPLAAALNGVKGATVTLNRRRGRKDALHAAFDQARIDSVTFDTVLDAIQESLPFFNALLKSKAAALGKKTLPWWDVYAPMGQVERRFTFAEAQSFITAQFDRLSPRLGALAQRAFERNWIDAEPRTGKQGGAYCNGVPGADIFRILCNFDGSLTQVFVIAHELGHAYHWHCQAGKTFQQWQTPLTLAESASLFCETLVTEQALADAASLQEELAILNAFLGTAVVNVLDTLSAFHFEKEVCERLEQGELSADELCEMSQRFQMGIYRDALDPDHLHPYAWAAGPHNFMPNVSFYNFPYAFGMLFSLGLYAEYRRRGASFVPEYESLLASTGEVMPVELAARFGIDLRQPGFWRASLDLIGRRIQRFQELCTGLASTKQP